MPANLVALPICALEPARLEQHFWVWAWHNTGATALQPARIPAPLASSLLDKGYTSIAF